MTLKLKNRWHYKGDNQWDWEAFLDDGGTGELSNVDHVEYVLHPTFPNPIRRITSPQGGFSLEATGWGTFELKAFVHTKDGKKVRLTHNLELRSAPEEGTTE